MRKLNKELVEKMIELYKEGYTYKEIGEKIGVTKDSVRGKLFKLGFKYSELELNKTKSYETITCQNCSKVFTSLKREHRKFCSHSCAATVTNTLKDKKVKQIYETCLHCGNGVKHKTRKFCSSKCQGLYKRFEIFKEIENGNSKLYFKNYRTYLIHKHGAKCMECGWDKVNPKTGLVPIQLDHIDGNSDNNELSNLRLLCPNCHSLTPTFGFLNAGRGIDKRNKYRKEWRNKNI